MNPSWWQLELSRPAWLAALAALPVLVYYWRRCLTDRTGVSRRLAA